VKTTTQDATSPVEAQAAHEPDLTFRGLDLCDGCGTRLEPREQLAGFCPQCVRALRRASKSRASRRRGA
jgi:predicted RNA-binding Zn-ribbon protein involved in translation (DUF1610 family)